MDVLVTGGSGMIGSYVVRELIAHHHQVTIFSRSPQAQHGVRAFAGDALNIAQLKAACRGKDAIVHLAAIPNLQRYPPERVLQVNVMGTIHVLEAAVQEGVAQVVLASSNAATGYWRRHEIPPDYLPLDEEHPCRPRDAYALSKCLNELTCRSYTAAHGVRTICLRIAGGKYLDRQGGRSHRAFRGLGRRYRGGAMEQVSRADRSPTRRTVDFLGLRGCPRRGHGRPSGVGERGDQAWRLLSQRCGLLFPI